MKLRFLYAILLMAIVMIKAEDDVDTDNILDNKDFGDIINKESSGNRGRSLNADVKNNDERQTDSGTDNENTDSGNGEGSADSDTDKENSESNLVEQNSEISPKEPTEDIPKESTEVILKETSYPSSNEGTNSTEEGINTTDVTTITSLEDYPYQVLGENGKPCILSRMTISLTMNYNTTNKETSTKILKVPSIVKVNGTCENDTNSMMLFWSSFGNDTYIVDFADTDNETNSIAFYFKKNGSTFSIDQINATIYMNDKIFVNAIDKVMSLETKSDLNLFASATDSKYVCDVQTVVKEDFFELSISNVNLIAFNSNDNITSMSTNYCPTDATAAVLSESANVGAIVGGIIGALVVVGIIGFIIWRRRRNTSSVRSEVA
ncbi:uncharacterized protein LOC124955009 [Vespa velutina]|uniref:uncharacterized protein LOC124955009 n=1 Tax=Vespa velutina TaxID=202808 RepID=UPI001FB2FC7F|nr:uncharacterized protein LOC124955009 [Vespa velutina]